jgi:hypothetical protein
MFAASHQLRSTRGSATKDGNYGRPTGFHRAPRPRERGPCARRSSEKINHRIEIVVALHCARRAPLNQTHRRARHAQGKAFQSRSKGLGSIRRRMSISRQTDPPARGLVGGPTSGNGSYAKATCKSWTYVSLCAISLPPCCDRAQGVDNSNATDLGGEFIDEQQRRPRPIRLT